MSKSGFDPERLGDTGRDRPVIPQILSAHTAHRAKGFTEIKVVGVGGAGINTLNRMISGGVQGIDFIAVNTDVQSLSQSLASTRLQVGERVTRGLGAGGDARVGERGAEAARDALADVLAGADMVFVTGGLGGGTGTGVAPVVAGIARQAGALTVGVITLPFGFEGNRRRQAALAGLERLRPLVDSLIVVANDRLMHAAGRSIGIRDAFTLADETLRQGIHGIADLILTPGLINLDFADVKSIMQHAGPALMAMGQASGEGRAARAVQAALSSPLLDAPIARARGVLLNITGGPDLALHEVSEIAERVSEVTDLECNLIFGAVVHPLIEDEIRVTLIATGFQPE